MAWIHWQHGDQNEYFDRRPVKKGVPYLCIVGDAVLKYTKNWLKGIKDVRVRWFRPCTIVYERPRKL